MKNRMSNVVNHENLSQVSADMATNAESLGDKGGGGGEGEKHASKTH